jgi:hypothetical protein
MPRYDNIFLTDTGATYNFTSTTQGGGAARFPQRPSRQAHSDHLLAQFNEAQAQFQNYTPEQIAETSYNTGMYVEFSGAEQYDLITKSLEASRQGIKLLNVRDVVTQAEDGSEIITTKATVFIPAGKEQSFLKKIADFATKNTKPTEKNPNGRPKNNDLVSSIESISAAITISAFWIGRPADIPTDIPRWYELWLDTSNEDFNIVKRDTFALLDSLNISHCNEDKFIQFPERLIILVLANRSNLLDVIKQGRKLAEIRKPAEPNAYFVDSSLAEQTEWADDLLSRMQFNDTGVAVCVLDTGVNRNHRLIEPYMPSTGMTVEMAWGINDDDGHGTNMAGVVLYNDLRRYLISNLPITLNHTIESVKILGATATAPDLYGAVTENAALLSEISSPTIKRVYCMAITDDESSSNDGQPSSWSGAVDKISFDGQKRLFIISAGNVKQSELQAQGYPVACLNKSVEDPAQAWNALTVGAYSLDTAIQPADVTRGYSAVAQTGELSPYSSTSTSWKSRWPIKPELVCDGGNVATDGTNYIHGHDDLSKLTLNKDISRRLFDTIFATSAATAQCSYIAAELMALYPNLHPETIRALLVHSARWTDAMIVQAGFPQTDSKSNGRRKLLRTCGYGVPDLGRAKDTLNNRVNMIIEGEIQPYEKSQGSSTPKMKEMYLHTLPWPDAVLRSLENTEVKVRITLSYFIEPGPGQKGWKNKYRYASCGLRFEIKRPNESVPQFQQRINKAMRNDDYSQTISTDSWYLGENNRNSGSIHSDVWTDTAINLAQCNSIAVFPVVGWWRERTTLKKYNSRIRYSLVVTLETHEENVDLYTPIMTKLTSRIPVPIARNTTP